MEINWSAFDGILGVAIVILVVWMALKLVSRLIVGIILLLLIAAAFFGLHFTDLGFG